jgi:hypothetical protein
MGRDSIPPATPDPFSATSRLRTTSPGASGVASGQERRHILPKDLPNAIKHLSDGDLDLLIAAALEEAKRRGRSLPSVQVDESTTTPPAGTNKRQTPEVVSGSLTRGQVNAVRAAFKAGVKPSPDRAAVWHISVGRSQGVVPTSCEGQPVTLKDQKSFVKCYSTPLRAVHPSSPSRSVVVRHLAVWRLHILQGESHKIDEHRGLQ